MKAHVTTRIGLLGGRWRSQFVLAIAVVCLVPCRGALASQGNGNAPDLNVQVTHLSKLWVGQEIAGALTVTATSGLQLTHGEVLEVTIKVSVDGVYLLGNDRIRVKSQVLRVEVGAPDSVTVFCEKPTTAVFEAEARLLDQTGQLSELTVNAIPEISINVLPAPKWPTVFVRVSSSNKLWSGHVHQSALNVTALSTEPPDTQYLKVTITTQSSGVHLISGNKEHVKSLVLYPGIGRSIPIAVYCDEDASMAVFDTKAELLEQSSGAQPGVSLPPPTVLESLSTVEVVPVPTATVTVRSAVGQLVANQTIHDAIVVAAKSAVRATESIVVTLATTSSRVFLVDQDGQRVRKRQIRITSDAPQAVSLVAEQGVTSAEVTAAGTIHDLSDREIPGAAVGIDPPLVVLPVASYSGENYSDRVAWDFLIGTTFQQEYGDDGRNSGFGSSSTLAALSVDTAYSCDRGLCGWIGRGFKRDNNAVPNNPESAILRTRLDFRLADAPVGTEASENKAGAADVVFSGSARAFSGTVSALVFPAWAAARRTRTARRDNSLPYDSFDFGVGVKLGFTGRERLDPRNGPKVKGDANNDGTVDEGEEVVSKLYDRADRVTLIGGMTTRFEHRQVAAERRDYTEVNQLPITFVQVDVLYYEHWAGKVTDIRAVIEAGIRVPGISSAVLPFYTGLYANVGDGPDDLRIFAGLVFKLDRLASFFGT